MNGWSVAWMQLDRCCICFNLRIYGDCRVEDGTRGRERMPNTYVHASPKSSVSAEWTLMLATDRYVDIPTIDNEKQLKK